MPVHVKCPGCGSVLAVPEKAAGSVLSCPQCHNQFLAPGAPAPVAAVSGGMPPMPPLPPMAASSIPPSSMAPTSPMSPPLPAATASPMLAGSKPLGPNGAGGGAAAASPAANLSPPPGNRAQFYPPGHTPPPLPPSVAFPERDSHVAPGTPPPISAPSNASANMTRQLNNYPPGVAPPLSVITPAPPLKQMPPSQAPRQTQAAKFIAADVTATKMDLGADGRLPVLQLEELDEEDGPQEPQASNPWLLIGVLGFSIAASVAMLFVDVGSGGGERPSKEQARRDIYLYYLPDKGRLETGSVQLKPYQQRLRDALLAYNRGDLAEERRCYRDVLDMLHAEGKSENFGITGTARGDSPPTDSHLEKLVSLLVTP